MTNLILTVEEVMQRHDRNLMERREKQQAALRATEKIFQMITAWQRHDRPRLESEEIVSIIFSEFEEVPNSQRLCDIIINALNATEGK